MNVIGSLKVLWAVYYRGLIILRQRAGKNLVSFFLSPPLYALAFGWGVAGMNQSFSIATEINISRFFNHSFEEYLLSPAKDCIIVLGNVLYGITKGLGSFTAVLIIGLVFRTFPQGGVLLIVPVLLNSFMFASLGVWIALYVKNHRDMNSFSSFVITPMSFIAGTFFSLKNLPPLFHIISEIIPLTHASLTIRAVFTGKSIELYHYFILLICGLFFFLMAVRQVRKAVV